MEALHLEKSYISLPGLTCRQWTPTHPNHSLVSLGSCICSYVETSLPNLTRLRSVLDLEYSSGTYVFSFYHSFRGVFYVVTLLFEFFCGCSGFCHRTEPDLFLFLLSDRLDCYCFCVPWPWTMKLLKRNIREGPRDAIKILIGNIERKAHHWFTKAGRGRWDLVPGLVSLYSVQQFQRRSKKCLSQSEVRAAILMFGSPQKHKRGTGRWVLAACKVSLNSVQWFQIKSRKIWQVNDGRRTTHSAHETSTCDKCNDLDLLS